MTGFPNDDSISRDLVENTCSIKQLANLWGGKSMSFLFDKARIISRFDRPVLITGEIGTGKTSLATAIHNEKWKSAPASRFVPVNCAAIPVSLCLSELFGHVKGAFSGARKDRKGYVSSAENGTLFLDEVHALPPFIQQALLQFLGSNQYRPVGKDDTLTAQNVRLIFATSETIHRHEEDNEFDEALYSRIDSGGMVLHIPPFRERDDEDKITYAETRLSMTAQEFGIQEPKFSFSNEAKKFICDAPWPYNLRHVKGDIRHILINRLATKNLEEIVQETEFPHYEQLARSAHIPSTGPFEDIFRTAQCVPDWSRLRGCSADAMPNWKELSDYLEVWFVRKVNRELGVTPGSSRWPTDFGINRKRAGEILR